MLDISYTSDPSKITPNQVGAFHQDWARRVSREELIQLWRGSEWVILAIANDRVIGYLAVIGDGTLFAFVSSTEVLPEFRGRGIGSEMFRLAQEHFKDRYAFDLICDRNLIPFYERMGMIEIPGMGRRNYQDPS